MQQRSGAAAVGRRDDLEVPERGRIDDHAVGAGAERDVAHVREVGLLRVAQVLDERAGGAGRGGAVVEAEPVAASASAVWSISDRRAASNSNVHSSAGVDRALEPQLADQRCGIAARRRHDHFARAQHRELVGQRLACVRPGVLGGREFAGGHVEQRRRQSPGPATSGRSPSRNAGSRASR